MEAQQLLKTGLPHVCQRPLRPLTCGGQEGEPKAAQGGSTLWQQAALLVQGALPGHPARQPRLCLLRNGAVAVLLPELGQQVVHVPPRSPRGPGACRNAGLQGLQGRLGGRPCPDRRCGGRAAAADNLPGEAQSVQPPGPAWMETATGPQLDLVVHPKQELRVDGPGGADLAASSLKTVVPHLLKALLPLAVVHVLGHASGAVTLHSQGFQLLLPPGDKPPHALLVDLGLEPTCQGAPGGWLGVCPALSPEGGKLRAVPVPVLVVLGAAGSPGEPQRVQLLQPLHAEGAVLSGAPLGTHPGAELRVLVEVLRHQAVAVEKPVPHELAVLGVPGRDPLKVQLLQEVDPVAGEGSLLVGLALGNHPCPKWGSHYGRPKAMQQGVRLKLGVSMLPYLTVRLEAAISEDIHVKRLQTGLAVRQQQAAPLEPPLLLDPPPEGLVLGRDRVEAAGPVVGRYQPLQAPEPSKPLSVRDPGEAQPDLLQALDEVAGQLALAEQQPLVGHPPGQDGVLPVPFRHMTVAMSCFVALHLLEPLVPFQLGSR
mmetsp:Transcript_4747/g.13169  ORF Transcript_4747/g.13169 Transcript_4747/m.13169 type:complete len:540 (+) Transcript_4747:890-2509(+)